MAVISLDFASTATWPSDRCCAVAQALTRCSGPSLRRAGAAQGLAVDGHVLDPQRRADGLHPLAETGLERLGLEAVEDAFEGVVGRDAVGQLQEAAAASRGVCGRRSRSLASPGHRR